MPDTGAYLLVGAIAAAVTFATTPVIAAIARRVGWVVEPEAERHVHKVATPDVGGIAMFIGFVVAFLVAREMDTFASLFRSGDSEPRGVLIAATLMFLVGFVDDIYERFLKVADKKKQVYDEDLEIIMREATDTMPETWPL